MMAQLVQIQRHFDLTEVDYGRTTGRSPSVTSLNSSAALSARQAAARFDWVYRARPLNCAGDAQRAGADACFKSGIDTRQVVPLIYLAALK
ncbi:hypothetical protein X742_18935 [Mesorhizobium sp. LNHC232B00]|nr:hypothetical protein X742_18935 [Mesorhizobium sp. LNHC232B00]